MKILHNVCCKHAINVLYTCYKLLYTLQANKLRHARKRKRRRQQLLPRRPFSLACLFRFYNGSEPITPWPDTDHTMILSRFCNGSARVAPWSDTGYAVVLRLLYHGSMPAFRVLSRSSAIPLSGSHRRNSPENPNHCQEAAIWYISCFHHQTGSILLTCQ